jgi:cyclohexa-1,5-dienecarbonyl-CoA hydratase
MNAEFQTINFRISDRVARISFNRPPLNVFNIAMMREINAALNDCIHRRELAAIIFEAAPGARAFSAGVAVEEHLPDRVFQMLDAFHSVFRTLQQLGKPIVAVVAGAALGGGCELIAVSDIVIAGNNARFGQPEIKLGVFPPVGAILLPRIIGERRARELILTGELIDADEALRLGLVTYVVAPEALEAKTNEILGKLRELSAAALGMTRMALDLGGRSNFESMLTDVENLYLHELMKTEDAEEGVRAFMAKKKPEWRNK